MMARVPLPVVDNVWRALRDGSSPTRPDVLAVFAGRYRDPDLVPRWAALDLIDDLGLRDLAHVEGFLQSFGVEPVAGFSRPGNRARLAVGGSYISLADVAGLLIRLERHGLDVDPGPLVDVLRPALAHKAILTKSELDCHWFARERHRGESVTLASDKKGVVGATEVRTATGYRAEAWLAGDGRAAQLWVRAPRYRRRRAA